MVAHSNLGLSFYNLQSHRVVKLTDGRIVLLTEERVSALGSDRDTVAHVYSADMSELLDTIEIVTGVPDTVAPVIAATADGGFSVLTRTEAEDTVLLRYDAALTPRDGGNLLNFNAPGSRMGSMTGLPNGDTLILNIDRPGHDERLTFRVVDQFGLEKGGDLARASVF
jgi:hypothetical protein